MLLCFIFDIVDKKNPIGKNLWSILQHRIRYLHHQFFFHPLTRFLFWIYCYILYYIILFLLLLIMCVPMGGWSNRFMKILCDFFSIPFFCFFKYTSHPVSQPSSHSTYGSPFEKNKFLISNIFIFSIKLLTEMKWNWYSIWWGGNFGWWHGSWVSVEMYYIGWQNGKKYVDVDY